jgi:catechol 2,3-dioxygenase-like lactoylglutathione lyase family enzyme
MEPKLPRLLGLWHVALNVRSLESMERFYVDVMGMVVEWRPDPENVYLTSGSDNLALHVSRSMPPVGSTGALDHFGFFLSAPDEVDLWFDHILRCVGRTDTLPRTHRDGARSFYFRDPEQNQIQLIHHPALGRAASP